MINDLKKELKGLENLEKAKILQGFFKTGKGQYGEGDIFLGIPVPEQRSVAKKYDLNLDEIKELLYDEIHEFRLVALFILIQKYQNADEKLKKQIYEFYLKNAKRINNWDLVDLSANHIVGNYLMDRDKKILFELAKSDNLWERRIAMLSCFEFIKNNKFDTALKISEKLLNDKQDLIHKAVGWMLREIGKRDLDAEENFLKKYYKKMPRTMLRYSIERFPENKRKFYMKK